MSMLIYNALAYRFTFDELGELRFDLKEWEKRRMS